jgi:hypothetical protein
LSDLLFNKCFPAKKLLVIYDEYHPEVIVEKLNSRKLWAAIVGVVVGLATAFGIDGNEYAEIAGIVTSAASVVAYIFGEAVVDAAKKTEGTDSDGDNQSVQ